jgi:hypothetical protein
MHGLALAAALHQGLQHRPQHGSAAAVVPCRDQTLPSRFGAARKGQRGFLQSAQVKEAINDKRAAEERAAAAEAMRKQEAESYELKLAKLEGDKACLSIQASATQEQASTAPPSAVPMPGSISPPLA